MQYHSGKVGPFEPSCSPKDQLCLNDIVSFLFKYDPFYFKNN